jgi:HK97 family phage major capsid protein
MNAQSGRFRGIARVRADASNVAALLADLNKTFADFKAEHEKELAGIKAKFADVVQTEKVARINDEIGKLQKAIDETNALIASARVGGNKPGLSPEKKAHAQAFGRFFRKGEEAGLRDLEVKAAMETQSNPDGGFLVPDTMEAAIDRVLGTMSAMRGLARVMTIGTPEYKKLVNLGGTASGWVSEKAARPTTGTPTLSEIAINAKEIYANPNATQTLLDDSRVDIEQWLADEVSAEFAEEEGTAFITGDGVAKPRGILGHSTVANASYAWGSLGFVVTGAAAAFHATLPADAFIDLYYALKAGYRNGATWITSDAVMKDIRKFKDGQNNYLWAPPTGPDMPATILGKPVVTDDNMPALAANAFPVAFGNFQRGYLIVDRSGVRVLRDPYTNKPYVSFYTTKRVGGDVVNFEAIKLLKCST